jgi:hypothetical protein
MFSIPAKMSESCGDERGDAFALPATAPVTAREFAALLRYLKNQSPHAAFIHNTGPKDPVSNGRKLRKRARATTNHCQTKADRRNECVTVLNVFRTALASGARSATDSLVSSGITPGEPLSAQRGAPIDSRSVARMIADFYLGFRPPNPDCGNTSAAGSPFREKEIAQ